MTVIFARWVDPAARGAFFYLSLSLLLFIAWDSWLFRRRVSRLFGPEPPDPAKMEEVRRQLDEIDEESALHTFGAKRAADIELRGHIVRVVVGTVAVPSAHGAASFKSVYAIVEGDEAEWMRHFPEVFEVAFAGKRLTVFWVSLPILLRLRDRP